MLRQIDPPLGFGKKCPERMAYKKLIRMNMPMDKEGKVSFLYVYNIILGNVTCFAIRNESLQKVAKSEIDVSDICFLLYLYGIRKDSNIST